VRVAWPAPRPRLSTMRRVRLRSSAAPTMIRGFPSNGGFPNNGGFGKDPTSDVPVVSTSPQPPKRALDDLVDFPCVFTFKVVGVREVRLLCASFAPRAKTNCILPPRTDLLIPCMSCQLCPTLFFSQGKFLEDISEAVARVLNTEQRHLKTTFRDRGKYRSITLHAPVINSTQIYDVYAVIDEVCLHLGTFQT
jgi:putative lipoic acid-binding regulatory protein